MRCYKDSLLCVGTVNPTSSGSRYYMHIRTPGTCILLHGTIIICNLPGKVWGIRIDNNRLSMRYYTR